MSTAAAVVVAGLTVGLGAHRAGAAPAAAAPRALTVAPGSAWAWGTNFSFEADPTSADGILTAPRAVSGLSARVVQMAASTSDGYALLSDGTVRVWGDDESGQFGNGTLSGPPSVPPNALAQPIGLSGITQIAAGRSSAFAIGAGGVVFGWGDNSVGQLGDGTTTRRLTPVRVPGLSGIKQIAANGFSTFALASDGTVWSWGSANTGPTASADANLLGDGVTTRRLTPGKIPGLSGVTQLATGDAVALALLSDGTVRAWGDNVHGEIGVNGGAAQFLTPQRVLNLSGIVQVAAGGTHAMAADRTGQVWTWGASRALAGDGGVDMRPTPVLVPGLTGVTQVAANLDQSFALTGTGAMLAWGFNGPQTSPGAPGTLGVGSGDAIVTFPRVVAGRERVTQLVTGSDNAATSYAVTAGTGEVYGYAWADQPSAALNTPYNPSTHFAADSAGTRVSVTRTAVGTYTVTFPGLGVSGQGGSENVQLSTFGTSLNHCTVDGISGTLNIVVLCSNPAGALADTSFIAQYFRGGASTHDQAYLFANQPSSTSYTAAFSFNSRGGVNTVFRRGPGNYKVTLPGFTSATGGNVAITAFGPNANYCKIDSWVGGTVNVLCLTPTGVGVDEEFMLRYTDQSVANDGHQGAYMWQSVLRDSGSYVVDPGSAYNSTGGAITVNQTAVGTYQVIIAGLPSVNATSALVTADNPGNTFCSVNGWTASGTGTAVNVLCHNAAGGLTNTTFALSYLTNL